VALLAATALAFFLPQADTIGTRFTQISNTFPAPSLPAWSIPKAMTILPTALTIAFLAGVVSLLSAVVADSMTGSRHDPNMELVAQGIGNIGSAFFGGIPVTGALARTAANIKNGGRTPVAGIVHAIALLMILLVGMPYVKYVPMSALAAVLMVVAYNMGEWSYFKEMKRLPKSDAAVFLTAFLLTVLLDLVMAIGAAIALAAVLVLVRLRNMVAMQWESAGEGVMRLKVNGPLFFMAAQRLQQMPERDREQMTTLLLDMAGVPFMDASALKALSSLQEGAQRQGIELKLENLQNQPQTLLLKNGFKLA
jgi:SulP family sulfate permease